MVLNTQHCPCGAYVMATFHNGRLTSVALRHFTRHRCHGQIEPLNPDHYWEPHIPTALADRRDPGVDLGKDQIMKWRDPDEPAPVRRRRPARHRQERLARR